MNYGLCDQTLVPVRIQPGDKYEMINQLLFGDVLLLKDKFKNWLLIETIDDQYDGWVDEKQVSVIDKSVYNSLLTTDRFYVKDLAVESVSTNQLSKLILTLGCSLPGFNKNQFSVNGYEYLFSGEFHHSVKKTDRDEITETAKRYLGAPYLWGGRSIFGIDCSGFVQMVFKINGIFLPRDSALQVLEGNTVNFIHEAKTGDLAFFGNDEGNIIHAGILLNNNQIIHASGKVRIDNIDHQGIFNTDTKQYSHQLRIIKSFFK
jgi:gamma-D-glutamyl-L-lysine dipeptidyl-peptidase